MGLTKFEIAPGIYYLTENKSKIKWLIAGFSGQPYPGRMMTIEVGDLDGSIRRGEVPANESNWCQFRKGEILRLKMNTGELKVRPADLLLVPKNVADREVF